MTPALADLLGRRVSDLLAGQQCPAVSFLGALHAVGNEIPLCLISGSEALAGAG